MKFSSLDLSADLLSALDACGYTDMTPVQQQAIVPARRGKDILANAQTGTGKTAAFALPILQQMTERPKDLLPGHVRALILTPTRELAEQLADTIGRYAQNLPLSVLALYGGTTVAKQANKLAKGVDLLIATPGRLIEHAVECNLHLSQVEFMVLDEADRMLDMGFLPDVSKILQQTPESRQSLLFSATISPEVNELSKQLLKRPEVIRVARQNVVADTIDHVVYEIDEQRKPELFAKLIKEENWFQVLVFTSTKAQADSLAMDLKVDGIKGVICHGDISQGARRRALADFKSGKVQVLIATEVAARGLDIQGLEHVVNFNLPYLAEDYVHRVGRAGRAGMPGRAISFVSREEERTLNDIEHLIGSRIKRVYMDGFEVSKREGLKKYLKKARKAPRSNKVTRTKIVKSAGAGKKKPSKRK
ncbi:DEAD/DEAH box helicase [Aliamphritea hakodatensis]|uniref:DEAD/DEAH box helicase n=1 Tax=Aliamphritea hakodatensis TaxID=2895352 RepID=UPI0022FD44C5|nr:DEAD/DEAH box helicase [Aliamphritea hakodatensis]